MRITRRVARPMLASVFVFSSVEVFQDPDPRAAMADPVVQTLASWLPLPDDTRQLVMFNAAAQGIAGTMLALGKAPRLAAAVLAASLVPTTLAGHRFWEEKDEARAKQQTVQFLKNVGLLGGLIIATFDRDRYRPTVVERAVSPARRVLHAAA